MVMENALLIYGANGYTGRLVVEEAVRRGLRPVLAGRDHAAIRRSRPSGTFRIGSFCSTIRTS
jgi:short subunit dehydrogenase-like uncharacterized protein